MSNIKYYKDKYNEAKEKIRVFRGRVDKIQVLIKRSKSFDSFVDGVNREIKSCINTLEDGMKRCSTLGQTIDNINSTREGTWQNDSDMNNLVSTLEAEKRRLENEIDNLELAKRNYYNKWQEALRSQSQSNSN